jgi:hypothetical protein
MNKRIKDLADEAKKQVPHGLDVDKWIEVYNEKLAQLIVGECVDIADEYDGVGSTIVSRIKQHFGVEE